MLALGPRWCTGVDGIEGLEDEGVDTGVVRPDSEGDREEEGVKRPSNDSVRDCLEDGVCGSCLDEGVRGKMSEVSEEFIRLDGVTGKGTANSCGFLFGDLSGSFEGEGVGEPGRAKIVAADGDFGDAEASRRVRVEGFEFEGRGGKSAKGRSGIGEVPAWSFRTEGQR